MSTVVDPLPARRIYMTGGPGAGKTTFALRLAAHLGCEAHDLDLYAFDAATRDWLPMVERRTSAARIAATESWVAEGNYVDWTDALLDAADLIVWIDLPWRAAAWRIFTRHVKAELRRDNRHPGWLRLLTFLRWCRRYYLDLREPLVYESGVPSTRTATQRYFERYSDRLVVCRRDGDLDYVLQRIAAARN